MWAVLVCAVAVVVAFVVLAKLVDALRQRQYRREMLEVEQYLAATSYPIVIGTQSGRGGRIRIDHDSVHFEARDSWHATPSATIGLAAIYLVTVRDVPEGETTKRVWTVHYHAGDALETYALDAEGFPKARVGATVLARKLGMEVESCD